MKQHPIEQLFRCVWHDGTHSRLMTWAALKDSAAESTARGCARVEAWLGNPDHPESGTWIECPLVVPGLVLADQLADELADELDTRTPQ